MFILMFIFFHIILIWLFFIYESFSTEKMILKILEELEELKKGKD